MNLQLILINKLMFYRKSSEKRNEYLNIENTNLNMKSCLKHKNEIKNDSFKTAEKLD